MRTINSCYVFHFSNAASFLAECRLSNWDVICAGKESFMAFIQLCCSFNKQ